MQLFTIKDFEEGTGEASTSTIGADTEFHRGILGAERLTVDSDSFTLARAVEGDEKLKPHFNLKPADLKDPAGFVTRVQSGTDGVSKLLQSKLGNTLTACAAGCDEAGKQNLVNGLNKILNEESLSNPEKTNGLALSVKAQKLIGQIDAENKKRVDDNAKLDEEIAKAETPEDKEAKAG